MKGNTMSTNDIMNVESNFFRSLGNGVKAGEYLQAMILSVVQSRDTTVLVRAMDRARNAKNDEQAARTIALVVGQVWPKCKLGKDKNSIPTIKISGIDADPNALKRLKEATDKGLSIRHSTYRKVLKGDTDTPEFDLKKSSVALAKREQRNGITKAAALAAFAAAWDEVLQAAS